MLCRKFIPYRYNTKSTGDLLVKLYFPPNAEATVGEFISKVPKNQFYLIFWDRYTSLKASV